jgi:hypothetical protein
VISVEQVHYHEWLHGVRLANGQVDLVFTTQVGPRIVRFGFLGEDNEFAERLAFSAAVGDDTWYIYGGHRLWHAPEVNPRTYQPDNAPIVWQQIDDFVRVTQTTERLTGIQKELDIWLAPDAAHARVTHRLTNQGVWPVELSPWAISVMAPGGVGVIPLPPRGSHTDTLLPTSTLTLWAYTDLADPRWTWGTRFVLLRQDSSRPAPQKIGASTPDGWVAYARRGHLFVKTFTPIAGASYPDMNCMVELFTNDAFQEIETFGPVVHLAPGASVEHTEQWHLLRDTPQPNYIRDVETQIAPKVEALRLRI